MKYTLRTQFFFSKLVGRIKKASDKGLHRVCGLIRSSTRRNLKRRSSASLPGTPPSAHTIGGLRLIEFVVRGATGFVGPVKFAGSNFFNSPIPHIHEFGGTYMSRKWYAQYPKRSYMLYTLKQLIAKGMIPRIFSIYLARM
jgi:hypothetical protein